MTTSEYEQRVATDPNYRHTAQRWQDHLTVYPELDRVSQDNCRTLIRLYEAEPYEDIR